VEYDWALTTAFDFDIDFLAVHQIGADVLDIGRRAWVEVQRPQQGTEVVGLDLEAYEAHLMN
jgi:hypothetical protein